MAHARRTDARAGVGERGYVLLTAMWLLLLGGAIAGLMLLGSVERARGTKANIHEMRAAHAIDSAIATVAADRLFRGGASRWAKLPVSGELDIDGVTVTLAVSSEAARLDLNAAAADVVGRYVRERGRSWGLTMAEEQYLIAAILRQRAKNQPIRSVAELIALMEKSDADVMEGVAVSSGATDLRSLSNSSPLGGAASAASTSAAPVRIGARTGDGAQKATSAVIRLGGQSRKMVSVVDAWSE